MTQSIHRDAMMDHLKVLLIACVVLGHAIENYIEANYLLKGFYAFIYLFHMEIFIFISGYFSKNAQKAHRFAIRNYLFPYIFFNLLAYIVKYLLTGTFDISWINPAWSMWYLLVIFLYRYFLKYIIQIPYHTLIAMLIALVIGVIPYECNDVIMRFFTYLPFFLLGYQCHMQDIQQIQNKFSQVFSFLMIIFCLGGMIYCMKNEIFRVSLFYNNAPYWVYDATYIEGIVIRLINFGLALLLMCCFFKILPKKQTCLSSVGLHTGCIYIFHTYFIRILKLKIPVWPTVWYQQMVIFLGIVMIFILSYNRVTIRLYEKLQCLWVKIYDELEAGYRKFKEHIFSVH